MGGSTGEAPLLDEDELLRLVERGREAAADRLVIAGTGAESTRRTIRLCADAARRGADAALVRPPYYYRSAMTAEALRAHFLAVADASPIPVLLYHVPKYVPVDLAAELVAVLAAHENVVGIKDSSGDVAHMGALAEACEGRAVLLVGSGSTVYAGLELGATGGILAVALPAPAMACALYEAWEDGDPAAAGRWQEMLGPLNRTVVGRHGVPGVKYALDRLGYVGGPPRPPLLPLPAAGRREVDSALVRAGLVAETAGPSTEPDSNRA